MITMILLVVVFLAVVVPQAMSARAERHREFLDSIAFHAGKAPIPDVAPGTNRRAPSTVARRKTIFVLLLGSIAVTAVPALLSPGKATLVAQLAVDNCFLAYVGLLVRWRDARAPIRRPAPAPAPAADLVLTPATVQPVLRIG